MIITFHRAGSLAGLVLAAAGCALLAGCNKAQEVQTASVPAVAAPTAPAVAQAAQPVVVAQPTVIVQDDYVYYPSYEVYYSSNRHQYLYRDGDVWVTRSAPPRVSVDVLFASPSVRMDFHDSPEHHHESIVRSYPRNWAPPGRGVKDERRDGKKDEPKDRR